MPATELSGIRDAVRGCPRGFGTGKHNITSFNSHKSLRRLKLREVQDLAQAPLEKGEVEM